MNYFKTIMLLWLLWSTGIIYNTYTCFAQTTIYDIVIYGGTSAGITSAIQSSRMDKSVLLIEPTNRLGGLTTGGLGQTDIGNKQAIGGISREFYERIYQYYENPDNWNWQKMEEYSGVAYSRTEDGKNTHWTFEPSAALKVYHEMMEEENLTVVYGERLEREKGIQKNGSSIASISMENGNTYAAKMFIDATYANGFVKNEGNVQGSVAGPYPISYRSIIPRENEAGNLLVPVCLSATHIAFGSIRMEPVFMVLGQSAAIAASLAIDQEKKVQDLPYASLKPLLIQYQQRLENN